MKRFFTLANLPETRHETALRNNYGPEVVDDCTSSAHLAPLALQSKGHCLLMVTPV